MLPREAVDGMKAIAVARYPHEAVFAYFPDGSWRECVNVHREPEGAFALGQSDLAAFEKKPPLVLLHTHTSGSAEPSDLDTVMQLRTGWTWGIIALEGDDSGVTGISDPVLWGPSAPREPLLGRTYLWGVRDCWSLCRDFYALNGVSVPDAPRIRNPTDYPASHPYAHRYFEHWVPITGFKPIEQYQREPGDVCVMTVGKSYPNHTAIYLGGDNYLEHLNNRSSDIEVHRPARLETFGATYYRWKASNAQTRSTWSIDGPVSQGR